MNVTSKSADLRKLFMELGIDRLKAKKLISGGTSLRHSFDVSAEDFIQQAEDDFELKGSAAILNAISNANRAIHAQIDEMLSALGYKFKNWGFDKKITLFQEMGFVAPRILKRISDARNILEHEYARPRLEQVEEAIDLATLFVGSAKRHSEMWEHELSIGNSDQQVDDFRFSRGLAVSFDESTKSFCLAGEIDVLPFEEWSDLKDEKKSHTIANLTLLAEDPLFSSFVRLVVAGDRTRKTREALDLLFDQLQL